MNNYQKFIKICNELNHYPSLSELIYKYGFTYNDLNEIKHEKTFADDFVKLELNDQSDNKLLFYSSEKILANFFVAEDLIRNSSIKQFFSFTDSEILNGFVFSEIESSLAIEGIRSTRAQIIKLSKTAYEDLNETNDIIVKNMLLAYEFIKTHNIEEENVYKLYNILTKNCLKENELILPGNYYRHDDVNILGGANTIVDKGVNFQLLPKLMKQLIEFINIAKTYENHLITSHIIHYYILFLHPYFDYNGRMARVMSLWYNLQFAPSLSLLLVSEAINNKAHKADYYNAITNSRKAGNDLTYFLEYLGKIILEYSKVYVNFYNVLQKLKNKGHLLTRALELTLKYVLALSFSQENYFTWKDYKSFSQGEHTKQYYLRLLNELVSLNILEVKEHKNINLYKLKSKYWDLY